MKYKTTEKFDRDVRRLMKVDPSISKEAFEILDLLYEEMDVPDALRNHRLRENWQDFFECHVRTPIHGQKPHEGNDVLLIYRIRLRDSLLVAVRLGSHRVLFGK